MTPRGSRKHAAGVGIPVRLETTAEPPVNNIAVTRMLVMRPNTVKTKWADVPYRALTTSRKVYSSQYLSFGVRSRLRLT